MCTDLEGEVKSKYILHWSYRNYTSLPEELLHHGTHVEEIYLRENHILSMPKWLTGLTNLTHLYLAGNNMQEFPFDVDKLVNLCYIELSRNKLVTLPSSIVSLRRLSHLIVDFNLLQALPKELGRLKALYMLHVNDNQLRVLPESVCQCVSLSELCLHNNQLTSLPQPIVYLPNLETLSIHGNNLLYLPSIRFVCNCHLTFYNNPHLNYLSYHLTYGHDGDLHHLMSGCGGSVEDISELTNLVLTIPQHQRHLVLPNGLTHAFSRPGVPSLFELALRATYAHTYKIEEQNRYSDKENLEKLPLKLQKLLYYGPTSNCVMCNRNIFQETFLSVFLRSHISEHRKLFAVMFLCSARCLSLYTSRVYESTVEKVQWYQAL
ncbi:leucine-rich repeat-containing protein 28-like [Macrosteles quadrilineatus]|uniref:leucine-rich repeat-containing protein 28-like n=1 Tax=Macrosteles quadrilineatus TaxID=74068 RepID=UPI0023E0F3BE|nr:leucine-rich repeat-containing protein 28-like [Macrosteles quadrilineatus]